MMWNNMTRVFRLTARCAATRTMNTVGSDVVVTHNIRSGCSTGRMTVDDMWSCDDRVCYAALKNTRQPVCNVTIDDRLINFLDFSTMFRTLSQELHRCLFHCTSGIKNDWLETDPTVICNLLVLDILPVEGFLGRSPFLPDLDPAQILLQYPPLCSHHRTRDLDIQHQLRTTPILKKITTWQWIIDRDIRRLLKM